MNNFRRFYIGNYRYKIAWNYSHNIHKIFVNYSSSIHQIFIKVFITYSSSIHQIFIKYSSDIHRVFTPPTSMPSPRSLIWRPNRNGTPPPPWGPGPSAGPGGGGREPQWATAAAVGPGALPCRKKMPPLHQANCNCIAHYKQYDKQYSVCRYIEHTGYTRYVSLCMYTDTSIDMSFTDSCV